MPGPARPKSFVAARDFRYRSVVYRRGDPVTDRRTIDRLVRYGTRFVRSAKTAPAETQADLDSAPTPNPAESPKEF
jgi:hypothetical protein